MLKSKIKKQPTIIKNKPTKISHIPFAIIPSFPFPIVTLVTISTQADSTNVTLDFTNVKNMNS